VKRRTCASCDKPLRKGAGKRAWVLSPHGESPKMGIVCPGCAQRVIPVVVPPPVTVPPACSCGRGPAKFCAGCYDSACRNVGALAAANVAGVRVPGLDPAAPGARAAAEVA
jgi:hypothetical protein